jgi:hypothetical protein
MEEVSTILGVLELPKQREDDPPEALVFLAHSQLGLVVQVAVLPERMAGYDYDTPLSVPMPRDAALRLAHSILTTWAPSIATIVERECVREQLRLVSGGADEPEAS